jgi:hypothetical protein
MEEGVATIARAAAIVAEEANVKAAGVVLIFCQADAQCHLLWICGE